MTKNKTMEINKDCMDLFINLIGKRADYFLNSSIKILQNAIETGKDYNKKIYGMTMGKMSSYQEVESMIGLLLINDYQGLKAFDFVD